MTTYAIVQAILQLTAQYEALPADASAFYKAELTATLQHLNHLLRRNVA